MKLSIDWQKLIDCSISRQWLSFYGDRKACLSELATEIDGCELAKIVEDEPVRIGCAQDLDLIVLESRRRHGEDAVIVPPMSGMGMTASRPRQLDLGELVVGRRPEMTAPGKVQRVDRDEINCYVVNNYNNATTLILPPNNGIILG